MSRSRGFQVGSDDIPLCQGVTDSEKRVQHLTLENEALKQSLSLTRDLLLHWGPSPLTRAPQVLHCLAAVGSVGQAPYTWCPSLTMDKLRGGLFRVAPSIRLMLIVLGLSV